MQLFIATILALFGLPLLGVVLAAMVGIELYRMFG